MLFAILARISVFHFDPKKCHFAPTYYLPFSLWDYVWIKRIMSTLSIFPVSIEMWKYEKGVHNYMQSHLVVLRHNLLQQWTSRAPSQYPKRRLSVRSRKVSKPRDLYLELSDRYEIWQALRQQCCRCACQISKRYGNLKYQSRGFETLRDLMERRLFGYWDGAQRPSFVHSSIPFCPQTVILPQRTVFHLAPNITFEYNASCQL